MNYQKQCTILPLSEGKVYHEPQTELFSYHSSPELQSGWSGFKDNLAEEGSDVLCLYRGYFKDLTSTVCGDRNSYNQELQTVCEECEGKIFQCGSGR